ncbi:MAG: ParB/RepB/Spo0J family partition protein [Candidatus Bathyarchaeia archaeon]
MSSKDQGWVWVKLADIELAPYNVNTMDEETFGSLMDDMNQRNGAMRINPIELRPLSEKDRKPYEVVDGNQRWTVAAKLHWDRIRATIRKMDEGEARIRNFRLNNERGHVNPVRQAEFFQSLLNLGWSIRKMERELAIKRQRIQQILRRLKVTYRTSEILERVPTPKQIQKNPNLGKWSLSAQHYEALGGIKDPKTQEQLAKITIEQGLAARQTKKLAQLVKQGLSPDEATKLIFHPGGKIESEQTTIFACKKCKTAYTISWEDRFVRAIKQ